MCVCVLEFYVSPTTKVIRRWDLGLKTHPKVWEKSGIKRATCNKTGFLIMMLMVLTC